MQQVEPQEEFLAKSLTGIQGFDQITNGGLPKGRITLLVGGPRTGKKCFNQKYDSACFLAYLLFPFELGIKEPAHFN